MSGPQFAFKDSDKIVLCITTLRHRRYIEDVVHAASMPMGSHLRLRYRRQYVATEVWDSICDDPKDAFILFAVGATDTSGSTKVMPLRKGKLIKCRREGSILVLDVSLREYLVELAPQGTFWTEARSRASDIPTSFGSKASPGNYVQRMDGSPGSLVVSTDIDSWEQTCDRLFELDDISRSGLGIPNLPFLYGVTGLPSAVASDLYANGAFEVEAGRRVHLEIQTLTRKGLGLIRDPVGEIRVELSHGAAQLTTSRSVRIDSQRDVRLISLATTALFRRTYGHISFRMVCFRYPEGPSEQDVIRPADERKEVVLSRYDFPLRVGKLRPWIASTMVAGAAAIATYEAPKDPGSMLQALILPSIAFSLALFGLALGLKKES